MEKIYASDYRCHASYIESFVALYKQFRKYRWQIWLTIQKTIRATYQQDTLGLFWSIVMPIIPMTVYMVLAEIKVFKTVEDMPFVYYISMGMLVWLLMATGIHSMLLAIKEEKAILSTTNFPIFPVLLSRLGSVLHDSGIRLIVVILIIFLYGIHITLPNVLLAILSLIPALFFAMGMGMILSIVDIVIQDTRRVVLLALRYGLFVSSVIFPFPEEGIAGVINDFNVFNTYVNATRDLLYHGVIHQPLVFFLTSVVSVIVFIFATKLIYTMEYKVRAYL